MKTKPWIDENGNLLSDAALKEISRGWSTETWNAYLDSLEFHVRTEEEFSTGNLASVEPLASRTLADCQPDSEHLSDELLEDVKQSIERLAPRERLVIEEELYLGKGQRTIAEELGVSRSVMRKARKRARAHLAKSLRKYRPY